MELELKKKRVISFKLAKKIIFCLIFVLIFDFFFFAAPILASEIEIVNVPVLEAIEVIEPEKTHEFINKLPLNEDKKVIRTSYHTLTAYNSEAAQCDSTPCITANNFNVCEHGIEDTVAANFLKFGTQVRIPELFGDRIFIVRDRMNKRYPNRMDIWMIEKVDAKKFGVRYAKIEILEP